MKKGTAKLLLIFVLMIPFLQFGNQNTSSVLAESLYNSQNKNRLKLNAFQDTLWTIDHNFPTNTYQTDFIAQAATEGNIRSSLRTRSLNPTTLEIPSLNFDFSDVGSQRPFSPALAKVVYVYAYEEADALAYEELLESKGFMTEAITLSNVDGFPFADYDLIILADDTGWNNDWGMGMAEITAIYNSGAPILGLGEGGYAYFGQIDLEIGSSTAGNQGVHGNDGTLVVADDTHDIFNTPTDIGSGIISVYSGESRYVSLHYPSPPENVDLLGRIPSSDHYALTLENDMYFLWGFREDPDTMTQTGKDLMLNVVAYLTGVQFIDSIWIDEDADFI
ncbi:MAG: hypothetical protein ACXADX_20670, partial [Candidatus Hodarchaeales archaeon]